LTIISEESAASVFGMEKILEAAGSYQTLVNFFQTTWHNIPENSDPDALRLLVQLISAFTSCLISVLSV
jgi:hypothetical protein